MKVLLFVVLSLRFASQIFAQAHAVANTKSAPQTYAVVVGISTYQNSNMPQLEYAHKDALFFADYLKSKAGGSVPVENIRLLVNETATYAAIYDALDWLLTSCHKDDLVYFYFSGHGDMENSTIYKLGFLLSYNTPRTNYINNAVRIEDLNNIANTLSVQVNARVVLITDACHSGKLAGADYRGSYLVGEQLKTVQQKEIRITSCAPAQLSQEDQGWGGGRGVFSWYLVNGLEGMADKNRDKTVTVEEIKEYLDSSLAADPLLTQKDEKQSPVIKGVGKFQLSRVDTSALSALINRSAPRVMTKGIPPIVGALAPLPAQPQTWFFNLLQKQNPEELFDFAALDHLPAEQIAFACLRMLSSRSANQKTPQGDHDALPDIDLEKIDLLKKTLQANPDALNRFNSKLAVTLSDRGQEIINLYLGGDAAELERRNYYNSKSNGYDVYPRMFSVALKLTPPDAYLSRILQIKLHYFAGVAARLKIPIVADPRSLTDTALAEQTKAYQLEENAAYIQNELGILYLAKNDFSKAEKYFLRATQIAPQWVLPWSNLSGLYISSKKYDKAAEAIKAANAIQPDFQGTQINSGLLNEKKAHLLTAEEAYRKSIRLNSRHYLPFERLGYVYMAATQYTLSDSFFYEADQRKKGFHFTDNSARYLLTPIAMTLAPHPMCDFDSTDVGKNDVLGQFDWALRDFENGRTGDAEKKFKQVIALDKKNPLAFHYLGRLLYQQKRWEEAALVFDFALSYHLTDSSLGEYVDSISRTMPPTKSKECIVTIFRDSYYNAIEDQYFAGRLYQFWNHFEEAEKYYRNIIRTEQGYIGAYYLLWRMLEDMGRFRDAEKVLMAYEIQDKAGGDNELNAFYKRMIGRYPDEGEWYYTAGLFLYHLCADDPDNYQYDRKEIKPDSHVETYLVSIDDATKPEIIETTHGYLELPGINEAVQMSNKIIYPRTEGISCLRMADSLLAQNEALVADVNYKIGDLCVWQGLAAKAIPYYRKSVGLKPENASTRLKLIDIYNANYYFSDAMEQLDSLYSRVEINFDKQLLMAGYDIKEGRFDKARGLLLSAQQIHPYKVPKIGELNGRLALFAGKSDEALTFYKDYLLLNPGDTSAMYTVARTYARTGHTADAWNWLEKAMANGFRYSWVLKLDTAWDGYRKQPKWAALLKKFPAKQYAAKKDM